MIKKLEKSFGGLCTRNTKYLTPGKPIYSIVRPVDGDKVLNKEDQDVYRSGVDTLQHFVKHSRPDISNIVQELSKCMDSADEGEFKEMKRYIKFVLDTRDYGLRLKPNVGINTSWHLTVYSDSDWAGDRETRQIVTGFILFVLGVPVLWRSKAQRSVALSSSEAEYYAINDVGMEVTFLVQLLESMDVEVQLPITIFVDNIEAIFRSENSSTTSTRHVDVRYHYIREFVEDGFVKIIFVEPKDNRSDILTKNVSSEV